MLFRSLEGCIAERYIVEECLTFCSRYMEGVETIFNRPMRKIEESTWTVSNVTLDNREFTQAHRYVLFNSENIYQFRKYYGHQYYCTTIQCILGVLTLTQLASHAGCTKVWWRMNFEGAIIVYPSLLFISTTWRSFVVGLGLAYV